MLFKPRSKPRELSVFEALSNRKQLLKKERQQYYSLRKGYEGELLFDSMTNKLQCECLILNDLLLEVNNTTFQIDSLIISQEQTYFFEVKNFEGDYNYEDDKLIKLPAMDVINPLHQLARSTSLLHQLLLSLGFNLQLDSSVVFINSAFTLYQAPLDKPIIFPTQVKSYLNQLNAVPSKLNDRHKKLANDLAALHITDSPFKKIPSYEYNQLYKGINCSKCHSFSISLEKSKCICDTCGIKESTTEAVLRSVNEFKVLFPDQKITTNIIQDWCQIIESKKIIRRILASNFRSVGSNQWTYYE